MRQTIRKFLHDTTAQIAGLNGSSVIWANQGAPKQSVPIVTLRAYAEQAESMADHSATDTVGEVDLRTPTAFVLELQYYGKGGSFPVDSVNDIVRALEKPTIVDSFVGAGVAFLYADPVQDLTDLLGNDQQYEPRAAVDLHFRYTAVVADEPGTFDTVNIYGETPAEMNWTITSKE